MKKRIIEAKDGKCFGMYQSIWCKLNQFILEKVLLSESAFLEEFVERPPATPMKLVSILLIGWRQFC